MTQDPYRYFRVEARELLGRLGQGVLDLEKGAPPAQLVQELLRHAHTLKGAARVVKQPAIAEEAHAVEDALAPLRGGSVPAGPLDIDGLLARLDHIKELVTQLTAPAAVEPSRTPERAEPAPSPELSTDPGEIDSLIDSLSEALGQIGALRRVIGSQSAALSARPATPARVPGTHGVDLTSCLDQLEREMSQARDAAVGLRLVRAQALFGPLERIARDTARALGKQVAFEASGGELRLGAPVLRHVQDCLVQIVRNAVAHGIEDPAGRRAAGKPPQGRVRLEVVRRGDHVAFVCRDDGKGIDLAGVRRVAQAKGLLGAASADATAEALIELLLRGGLSTSEVVTEVSGRGVGLDLVRETTARMGGKVHVQTNGAQGTTVEIVVPLSLAALEALIVTVGKLVVAIPLDAVRQVVRVPSDQFAHDAAGSSILQDGRVVPFAPLSRCLGLELDSGNERAAWTSVMLSDGERIAALGVERLVGTARVLFRKLPALAPAAPVVAGVALDVDGSVQLILDPKSVVFAALHPCRTAARALPATRPCMLIVDDSLTTRMLEQSILESAGYEVELAVSGEDALEKAARRRFALFLVDVEMPGMDGFALIGRIRSDPNLRDTPAILVTSRDSSADRRRGELVGASAHISKGHFDQAELLGRIKELIG